MPLDPQPETMSIKDSSRSPTSEEGSTHSQTVSIDLQPETVAPHYPTVETVSPQYPTVETGAAQPSLTDIRAPPPSLLYFPPNYSYGCLEKKWSL